MMCLCMCVHSCVLYICVCADIVYSGYLETSAASVAVLSNSGKNNFDALGFSFAFE